jgi:imidazolonepropionase-like amidohydrolase
VGLPRRSAVSYEKLVKIAGNHKKAYALAVKSGVKIALGTDQDSSDVGSDNTHGRNGKEMFYAVEAGMTELQPTGYHGNDGDGA